MNFEEKYITIIDIPRNDHRIKPEQTLLFAGSCFSEYLSSYFKSCYMQVENAPFGQIYNPLSMGQLLKRIMFKKMYTADEAFEHKGLWRHYDFHTKITHSNKDDFIESINRKLEKTHSFLKKTDWLFLTLGTSWGYFLSDSGSVVNNCHTLPSSRFVRRMIQPEEMKKEMGEVLDLLKNFNPKIHIVFTVSPVRHLRDSARENTVSKSQLNCLVHSLVNEYPVTCFPSYEILIDELRDYRWYAEDLIHPSQSAVKYIIDRFKKCFAGENLISYCQRVEKWNRAEAHRPAYPDSPDSLAFRKRQQEAWSKLENDFVFLKKIKKTSKNTPL